MSTTVTITDTTLRVEPRGIDKFWSLTRAMEFPLAHVRGATFDPGASREFKGVRNPGPAVPGYKWSGTFIREGESSFWNVTGHGAAVVVELADEEFARLYLTVDEPRVLVDAINAAVTASS